MSTTPARGKRGVKRDRATPRTFTPPTPDGLLPAVKTAAAPTDTAFAQTAAAIGAAARKADRYFAAFAKVAAQAVPLQPGVDIAGRDFARFAAALKDFAARHWAQIQRAVRLAIERARSWARRRVREPATRPPIDIRPVAIVRVRRPIAADPHLTHAPPRAHVPGSNAGRRDTGNIAA